MFKNKLKTVNMTLNDKWLITQAELKIYWNAAERLIDEIIKVNYDEPNLMIYAQSIYNQRELMLKLQMNRDEFIQIMRAELNALRQVFLDCIM